MVIAATTGAGSAQMPVTIVTYPAGSLRETASVVHVVPDTRSNKPGRQLIFTNVTPFHPLDPLWPDQPADHGVLHAGNRVLNVHDTVTVASRDDGKLMVDTAIDARRDEPGIAFYVAHVVDQSPMLTRGAEVVLEVDEPRRRRLNAAHTGCHLLAYALNEVVHDLWRKPASTDSRGYYDFDAATCVSTHHDLEGSYDSYRLGKSLRKRGFDSGAFLDRLPEIIAAVNQRLTGWIKSESTVRIEVDGPALTDRREWLCEIPGGTARMPCGGTHVGRLNEIESMIAVAAFDVETSKLQITNRVQIAG